MIDTKAVGPRRAVRAGGRTSSISGKEMSTCGLPGAAAPRSARGRRAGSAGRTPVHVRRALDDGFPSCEATQPPTPISTGRPSRLNSLPAAELGEHFLGLSRTEQVLTRMTSARPSSSVRVEAVRGAEHRRPSWPSQMFIWHPCVLMYSLPGHGSWGKIEKRGVYAPGRGDASGPREAPAVRSRVRRRPCTWHFSCSGRNLPRFPPTP